MDSQEERERALPPQAPGSPREPYSARAARVREADEKTLAQTQSWLSAAQQKALSEYFREKRQAEQVASGVLSEVPAAAPVVTNAQTPAAPAPQGGAAPEK